VWGYDDPSLGRQIAEHFRACADPDALRAVYDFANAEWDITELAPLVKAATLVINNQNLSVLSPQAGQKLAASIPNSRFLVIDDLTYQSVPPLIADFLELSARGSGYAGATPSRTAIILFADIADSTALTEQLGDAGFRERARELDAALREAIRGCGGTAVEGKLLGDGVLAVFGSARQAIECALRCRVAGDDVELALHLGLHAGDVIREGGNVYGGAVNIAARIAGESPPGEILVSDTVRGLARTSAGVAFEDRGERELRGIGDPQRLFAVREGE
ncbi:MAG: adenylate/guanylate cyclase domain-containing protein, partial [Dehalococcoidia bacterium]|nr:adenylate/guanylate cyclase domain-containing protein [Dehalococcoidia bacterium]